MNQVRRSGLWFGGIPQAASKLDHVRIEYAGYDCACSLVTCSANIESSSGAVLFSRQPPSAFIINTVFKDIEGQGVTQGFIERGAGKLPPHQHRQGRLVLEAKPGWTGPARSCPRASRRRSRTMRKAELDRLLSGAL